MDQNKILHSKFNLKTHKANFINYFETIILPDGTIEYAIPSHAEKIYSLYMKEKHMTRDELYNYMKNKRCLIASDLAKELKVVMCWSHGYVADFELTKKQNKQIELLISEGLIEKGE